MLATELTVHDWMQIVKAEFAEMPGLQLTAAQMQRLWGLDMRTLDTVLSTLVRTGFLVRRPTGTYGRSGGGF
jgi:DNA-binding IclR family transcriptional regulator